MNPNSDTSPRHARRARRLNKSFATNVASIILIALGYASPVYGEHLRAVGFFAFSGAITNWLAVYMLFERVPGLYGSGVIPARFEEFKAAIRKLFMTQFFTQENVNRVVLAEEANAGQVLNVEPLLDAIDYDRLFERLEDAVWASSFGSALKLIGGARILRSLKDPFTDKIRETLGEMARSERFAAALTAAVDLTKLSADIRNKVEDIVERRLSEMTPQLVKTLVQELIHEHLGWLVVWGGVFGGLIGLAVSLFDA